ncbi:MAG: hypothetical protein MJE68_24335, partial [Proteobacteria bacterium]|nr:hypothetical protein [Pseudomonadota bacterium]
MLSVGKLHGNFRPWILQQVQEMMLILKCTTIAIKHISAGEPPIDPTVGFLPPNNGTTGQGFV